MKRRFLGLLFGALMFATAIPTSAVHAAPANEVKQEAEAVVANLTESDKVMLRKLFDAKYYRTNNMDLANMTDAQLWQHFITYGLKEGRQLNSNFNVNAFRSANNLISKVFGKNILEYYRYYVNNIKDNPDAINIVTTVEQAQKKGIIVSDFYGNHLAVSDKGTVVKGAAADRIIATNAIYSSNFNNSAEETESNTTSDNGTTSVNTVPANKVITQPLEMTEPELEKVDQVLDVSAKQLKEYNEAHALWETKEPKKDSYASKAYADAYTAWLDKEPNRDDYELTGRYPNKSAAERAYNADINEWNSKKPAIAYDEAAYNAAVDSWNESEPKLESYGMTLLDNTDSDIIIYKDAVSDIAVAFNVIVKDGYAIDPDSDGLYIKTSLSAEELSGAYTIIEEVLNEGYSRKNGILVKAVDDDFDYTWAYQVTDESRYGEWIWTNETESDFRCIYYLDKAIDADLLADDVLNLVENVGIGLDDIQDLISEYLSENPDEDESAAWDYILSEYEELDLDGDCEPEYYKRVRLGDLKYSDVTLENVKDTIFVGTLLPYFIYDNLDGLNDDMLEYTDFSDYTEDRFQSMLQNVVELACDDEYNYYDGVLAFDGENYYMEPSEEYEDEVLYYKKIALENESEGIRVAASKTLNEGYKEIVNEATGEVTVVKVANKTEATTTELKESEYMFVSGDDGDSVHKIVKSDDENLASYNSAHSEWENNAPDHDEFIAESYNAEMNAWNDSQPQMDNYTYDSRDYESQEAAYEDYEQKLNDWNEEMPVVVDENHPEYIAQSAYDEAYSSWESEEPQLDDFEEKEEEIVSESGSEEEEI